METNIQEENERSRLVGMAYNEVYKLLEEHKCPPSVLRELIHQGGIAGELELERLRTQNELNRRKAEAIKSVDESNRKTEEALEAMKSYYRK